MAALSEVTAGQIFDKSLSLNENEFRGSAMSKKILCLFAGLLCLGISLSVLAQGQGQGQGSSSSSSDGEGIGIYLLGTGDILDVRVFGQPDLNSTVEIDGDGNVSSLPFLETPIRAQCRTEKDVQKDITTEYSKYLRSPQVSVRIAERKSRQPATVTGAVNAPMQVTMLRRARLHELLAKAGGWTDRASGTVQVMHTQAEMCPAAGEVFQKTSAEAAGNFGIMVIKISELKAGKEDADPFIRPGDIVMVTEGESVYVTGAVVTPRELVLRDQLTLARAIAMAGGSQRLANTDVVHVYRTKDGFVGQEDLKFNYAAIRKGKEPDVLLKPNDIIEVGQSGAFSKKGLMEMFTGTFRSAMTVATQRSVIF
jgi:polysaccharide export outer membrane protein